MRSQVFPGENLELAIRRSGVSISEVAKRMHVNRRTVYNWFQQASMRPEIVCEVGYIIGQDFSKDFPQSFNDKGSAVKGSGVNQMDNMENEVPSTEYWMLKYIELLEKHNQVLANTKIAATVNEAA